MKTCMEKRQVFNFGHINVQTSVLTSRLLRAKDSSCVFMFMSTVSFCVSMVYTCSCVYIYVYTCLCMLAWVHGGICLYVQECVHVYVYVCIHLSSRAYAHAHMCLCMYPCVHACICEFICVCTSACAQEFQDFLSAVLSWLRLCCGGILSFAGFLEHSCPLPTGYLWLPLTVATT